MADAKMNAAWWKKNKALTLLDKGDTVLNTLKSWDIAKNGQDFDKINVTLESVIKVSVALKSKANKTLHKETIGYLETYIANSKDAQGNLKKADGKGILKNLKNLPSTILEQLKGLDKMFWISFGENLDFIDAMKSGKGTKEIYETFIKKGAKRQVNLPAKVAKELEAAVKGGVWSGEPWKNAVKEIKALVASNGKDERAVKTCEKLEKLMQLEMLKKM